MRLLWGIVAGVVVGLVLAVVWRRNPLRQIKNEFASVEAAAAAKLELLKKGASVTRSRILAEHAETIREFDSAQKARIKDLRSDPVELARWLTRVSS